MRKFLNLTVFTILGIVLLVIILQFHVNRSSRDLIFENANDLEPTYVGLVLGASVRPDKSLSPILQDRVDKAFELYHNGIIKKFLLSGDHGQKEYDEVNAMRRYLNDKGVPNEDIFLDHAGFDTYDSMFRAREVFQVEKAIVITQKFHLPRAIYVGEKMGLELQGYIADNREYPGNAHFTRREWLANIKAWIELNIEKSPTYSGKSIPITGSSSPSHDKQLN
ncbi:SanA protein [Nonlabens ulvanivorans]|uniref:SanA protein n=1 Tax=Nonlabens ulvanivorans TaxID=906888 RepID=A0A090QEZ4_NONUL|nr:ElyC/SanA/YdcF family protein [Nonlabens ulvanivorans]GAL01695.1 SanA protein [Nonlabens ulvanivorans]